MCGRMGKSLGNYIGVAETALNQFGKIMSVPDEPMKQYFTLLTEVPLEEVDRLLAPSVNPRDAKEVLGKAVVTQYHGLEAAERAAAEFRRRASGEDPNEIPDVNLDAGKLDLEGRLPAFILVKELGLESSTSNARRVIEQGGVSISLDTRREPVTDPKLLVYVARRPDCACGQAQDRLCPPGLIVRSKSHRVRGIVMKEHGFGIVGCGMIAEFHTRAINEIPNARVVAAWSRSPANGAKIAGMAGNGCKIFDDLDALLAESGLDVVCVCTPSGADMAPAVRAAMAGKHVVVEKPLEITLPRCDAIIDACDRAGVRLCTIFPSRFSPANLRLKEAISLGRFGRLTLGDTHVKWWRTQDYYDSGGWRGTWQLDGGGALMNQAIHNVDLLCWLMGDVASITAHTSTLAHERIEVEDTAVASLRFRSGALGVIEAATSVYPGLHKRTEIHGDRGSARVEQDDITLWDFQEKVPSDNEVYAAIAKQAGSRAGASDPRGITHAGHRDQLIDFLHAIDRGSDPAVDGREGRKSVEIIRAIYRSARTAAQVSLPLDDEV